VAFTTDAVKFVQNRQTFYVTALPVTELERCSVDRWDPHRAAKWKGYQRDVIPDKVRKIANYLERPKAIMPVAGLLNVREAGRLKFSSTSKNYPVAGRLTIPDYTRLWVVDMQHRLEGLKRAAKHFPFSVPVVIAEAMRDIDEASQFYIINTTSKRMDVALTRRLLIEHNRIRDLSDVPPWELKAVQVTMKLNSNAFGDNPWRGRIREPNAERSKLHIATEKSFVPSLRWLLGAPETKRVSARRLASFLATYWGAIRDAVPEAFEDPRHHLIQKTPGFMSLHRIAPIVYRRAYARGGAGAPRRVERIMRRLNSRGASFWKTRNPRGARRFGTGSSGSASLALHLLGTLGLEQK
jgi:DGQHR domain-containing protein